MTTLINRSRIVSESIDAGRETGRANIAGNTAAEIQASLMQSLGKFADQSSTSGSTGVKGNRVGNSQKIHFGR